MIDKNVYYPLETNNKKKFFSLSIKVLFIIAVCSLFFLLQEKNSVSTEKNVIYIDIPSDPTGKYELISLEKVENSQVIIATKRIGKDSEDFSKLKVNCKDQTFQGLGEGETLEEMNISRPTKEGIKLFEGSIKFYQVKYACSQ